MRISGIEPKLFTRWIRATLITIVALGPWICDTACAADAQVADRGNGQRFRVLILGDSLGLCGFCEYLDRALRKDPRIEAVFTYMACGTTPLSWLRYPPYAHIKTRCGFWSIESVAGSDHPREIQDTYGMRRHYSPAAHLVPKLDDLLSTCNPDLLVMQTGTNLFDLFSGRKSVNPERDGNSLKGFFAPFLKRATATDSPIRRIYWVASPTSGRVSQEIQDFVFVKTKTNVGTVATVIDSRTLVSYPYSHMEPDHEHFMGSDMKKWADGVFSIITTDLDNGSIANAAPLSKISPVAENPVQTAAEKTPESRPVEDVIVNAQLISKSRPIPLRQLLPYQELLVAYVYKVRHVVAGHYSQQEILVMHPAYISLQRQWLGDLKVGETYRFHLRPLQGTPWETSKSKDDLERIDLQPYIRVQDEAKYPNGDR